MDKDTLIGLILLGIGGILFFSRKGKDVYPTKQPFPSLKRDTQKPPKKVYAQPSDDSYIHPSDVVPDKAPFTDIGYTGWVLPPEGEPYRKALENASRVYQLPKNLLARVAYQESRFRPDLINGKIRSTKGAIGIMQIIPRWHPNVDATNPVDSIGYAASYLNSLHNQLNSWPQALAAYNWGIGNLLNKGIENAPTETRNYVNSILHDIQFYQNVG